MKVGGEGKGVFEDDEVRVGVMVVWLRGWWEGGMIV